MVGVLSGLGRAGFHTLGVRACVAAPAGVGPVRVAVAAVDHVVAGSTVERVVSAVPGQYVVAGESVQRVVSAVAGQYVVAGEAVEAFGFVVGLVLAAHPVVALSALYHDVRLLRR